MNSVKLWQTTSSLLESNLDSACNFDDEQEREFVTQRYGDTDFHMYRHKNPSEWRYHFTKIHRFMCVAEALATMSKDTSTKVGALIFGPGYEIRSQGWNGAPRGSRADVDSRFKDRDEKLFWAAHAEMNAITNAARTGTPTEGSALLATHFPCMRCAVSIVQAGIAEVICPEPEGGFAERWAEDIRRTKELFYECSVRLVTFTEKRK